MLAAPSFGWAQEHVEPPIPKAVPAPVPASPAAAAPAAAAPAPAAGAAPAAAAIPEREPAIDPSAVKECGMRVRKAGISLVGLSLITVATGLALLFDGANHPQDPPQPEGAIPKTAVYGPSRSERNAGYALTVIGAAIAVPGIYLWVKGHSTISEVERASSAPRVSSIGPTLLPSGGGLALSGSF
jgi:hypothetical protein